VGFEVELHLAVDDFLYLLCCCWSTHVEYLIFASGSALIFVQQFLPAAAPDYELEILTVAVRVHLREEEEMLYHYLVCFLECLHSGYYSLKLLLALFSLPRFHYYEHHYCHLRCHHRLEWPWLHNADNPLNLHLEYRQHMSKFYLYVLVCFSTP